MSRPEPPESSLDRESDPAYGACSGTGCEPTVETGSGSGPKASSNLQSNPTPTTHEGPLSKRSLNWLLILGGILVLAGWIAEVDPVTLFHPDSRQQMWLFLAEGFPPDLSSDYLLGQSLRDGLLWAVVETLAISIVGIVLAVVMAIPLGLLAASNVTHHGPLYAGSTSARRYAGSAVCRSARGLLSFLRSVPDLVWGFLFVTAVGLGPFAGVLALGIHNAGVLGKLYADFLEDTDPLPAEAVYASGATRLQAVVHGIVPQMTPTLVSYTLYRWECAIRAATILGFVGAGGIGYYLTVTITRLQYPKLLTAVLAVFALVVGADHLSGWIRRRLL